MKPRFFTCEYALKDRWVEYGVYFSEKFCRFFSEKMETIMQRETGLSASNKFSLSSFRQNNDLPMYERGMVSVIRTKISILPEFYDNINFCWKSKSGKIVNTTDDDFDESDIECWIEGLKPLLYWKQLNKEEKNHPFNVRNLPYQLIVLGFGTHMGIEVEVSDDLVSPQLIQSITNLAEKHNRASELKERSSGVVHNLSATLGKGIINFRIDNGSAGVMFIKKILRELAKFPAVSKIVLDH